MAALLMGMFVLSSSMGVIMGGINAAKAQQEVCDSYNKTMTAIKDYQVNASKEVASLQAYDEQLQDKIADLTSGIVAAKMDLDAKKAQFQTAYNQLETMAILTLVIVFFLLLFKRLGYLDKLL